MGWRDTLQAGSFRGAPFEVDSHDHQFGRRQETHEYPLRDQPWSEDLGRQARRWTIECLVLGENYVAQRDALIEATEAEGPGTLVHPYLGVRRVVCVNGRVYETTAEGGCARFSLEFVEAGEPIAPAVTVETRGEALEAADQADIAAAASFAQVFSIAGLPDFVSVSAVDNIESGLGAMEGAASRLTGSGENLYSFTSKISAIRNRAVALARAPLDLVAEFRGAVSEVARLAATPAAAIRVLRPLIDLTLSIPGAMTLTPSARQELMNAIALRLLVRQAAASEAVRAVSAMTFASYDDAVTLRDELGGLIDGLELDTADAGQDEAWRALSDLRLALVQDVTARGGSTARLFTLTSQAVEPALVLAHRIYGDAGRDGEIVARNRVVRPGFVPAGVPIELLTPAEAARG